MSIYLGIDWSTKGLVCAAVGEEGAPRPVEGVWEPKLASVEGLVATARKQVAEGEQVHAVIEAGSGYSVRLLHEAGATVYVVDGKQARRYAETLGSSKAKDDRRDAFALALYCRSKEHRKTAWSPDDEVIEQLDALVAHYDTFTAEAVRVRQRIRDYLNKHMPILNAALSKDIDAQWVIRVLRAVPTPVHVAKLSRAQLDSLMAGTLATTRDRVWEALQQTTSPWLNEAVARSQAIPLEALLEQQDLLLRQRNTLLKEVNTLMQSVNSCVKAQTIDGIGKRLAASLAVLGDRNKPPQGRDELAVKMGAVPVFSGSGTDHKGRNKGKVSMRRASSARGRRTAYLLGRATVQHLDWAKAMFADALARGQGSALGYRRVARCVLRIYAAMLRSGEDYDNTRYVAALKARGVRWAAAL